MSPRAPLRPGLASARRGAAGPREDARQSGARTGAGNLPAPPAAPPGLAAPSWARMSRTPSRAPRRRHVGLRDVGGQCRHRLARARHARRPMPPHGREPPHHGASQPRMAGDARAAAGSRSPTSAFAVHAPGSAGVRRRRRGEPYAPRASPRRAGRRRYSSTACAAAHSRRASISRHRGDRPAAPPRSRADLFVAAVRGGDRRRRVPQRCRRGRQRACPVRPRARLRRQAAAARRSAQSACPGSNMSRSPAADVPLEDAIRSYLFNAQLVTLPDGEHGPDPADRSARDSLGLALARTASSPATARSAG